MKSYYSTLVLCCIFIFGFTLKPSSPTALAKRVCTLTVEAGPDQIICEPGPVNLNGFIAGDYISAEWTPSAGVFPNNDPFATATVNATTTFTLTASSLDGDNLIVNSDFDGGLTGFTSDYVPGTGGTFGLLSLEGQFAVAPNANNTHTNFAGCTDHTGGGSMLVVNGAGVPNQNVWCQQVAVTPNTEYAFSVWVTSVVSSSPAQLQFSVNGTLLGNIFTASPTTCQWNQFFATWNSGGSSFVEICIVNQNTATSGNDFAIDDISFGELCMASDQVTITLVDVDASFTPPTDLCQFSPVIDLNTTLGPTTTPGGIWTVNGNTTQFFDPFTLGPGFHNVSYIASVPPCVETVDAMVFVAPSPSAVWTNPGTICLNSAPTLLDDLLVPTAEPNGTWTVDGSITTIFDPIALGPGPHQVVYSVGTPPCIGVESQFIDITPLPNPAWTAPSSICESSPAIDLNVLLDPGADLGGDWIINGVTTSIFDPSVLGAGIHSIVYTVGNFPCQNQLPQFLDIEAAPTVVWTNPSPLCTNASSIDLNTLLDLGTPSGGIWLINGTASSLFDPASLGQGNHTVSYTVGNAPCQSTLQQIIEVDLLSDVSWTPPASLCVSGPNIILNDLLDPSAQLGGNWTINGNPVTQINPSNLGTGTFSVTYAVGTASCTNTLTQNINIASEGTAPEPVCGVITNSSVEFVWPEITGAQSYSVTVLTGQNGTLDGNTFTVTGLAPDTEVQIQVSVVLSGPCNSAESSVVSCSSLDCPQVDITIIGMDSICLDPTIAPFDLNYTVNSGNPNGTATWIGSGIVNSMNGTFDHIFAGVGIHNITLSYEVDNCVTTVPYVIHVLALPTADFTLDDLVCDSMPSNIVYTGDAETDATYNWDFDGGTIVSGSGQGPYEVSWPLAGNYTVRLEVEQEGCLSPFFEQMVEVEPALIPPVISCIATDAAVTFSWDEVDGAALYSVNVLGGLSGFPTSNTSFLVPNLNAGDPVSIELTITSSNNCPDIIVEQTCVAEECPDISLDIVPIDPICLVNPSIIDLEIDSTGGSGTGTSTWSGPGIIDEDEGIFDPSIAGPGVHVISFNYRESTNCIYNTNITIEIPIAPVASFTSPTVICIEDNANITFDGTATATATFNWDFDGGTIISGSGEGPYEISWPIAGDYTISLEVLEGTCTSTAFTEAIVVEPSLISPVINCTSTDNAVIFSWNEVQNAAGYTVTPLNGFAGTFIPPTSYEVTNLAAGTEVRIELLVESANNCPDITLEHSCFAEECPDVSLEIQAIPAICLFNTTTIDWEVQITGGSGLGAGSWMGSGIIDENEGIFDPTIAGPGTHQITYSYQESTNCIYTTSLTFDIPPPPIASFTVADSICIENTAIITFTGAASNTAVYNWDFDGGTIISGTGEGPYEINWATDGTKTISLSIDDNGCVTELFSQVLQVDALLQTPVVDCTTDYESLSFSWTAIPNATAYEIRRSNEPNPITTTETSYLVENLNQGTTIAIEVVAISSNTCPSTIGMASCETLLCPEVELSIQAVEPICFENTPVQVNLAFNISGNDPNGQFLWEGPGIIDPINGTWEATADLVGQSNSVFLTYTNAVCITRDSIGIEVFQQPEASFSVDQMICVSNSATVTFTGATTGTANFDWDFGTGMATPGTGPGPHQVSWPQAGTYDIRLEIEENNCIERSQQTIIVEPILEMPEISCDPELNSVTFSWAPIQNASSYEVTVNQGPDGTFLNPTTYSIEGLNADQPVEIEVLTISDNTCPSTSAVLTCTSLSCPTIELDILPIIPICYEDGLSPIPLDFTIQGDNGLGQFTWSGSGINNPQDGIWNVDASMIDQENWVYLDYIESTCVYRDSIQIQVFATPVAAFTFDPAICQTESATIGFTGTASATAQYFWVFENGTPNAATGPGPHIIDWPEPGNYNISLQVVETLCSSEFVVQAIQVDPLLEVPAINCTSDFNSIVFSWDEVDNSTDYLINLEGNLTGSFITPTSYAISNLSDNQLVEGTLEIISANNCPSLSIPLSCTTLACPEVQLSIDAVPVICEGEALILNFNFEGIPSGPYDLIMLIGTEELVLSGINSGYNLTLDLPSTTTFNVQSVLNTAAAVCQVGLPPAFTVQVNELVEAGMQNMDLSICSGLDTAIILLDLLENENPNGNWTEISTVPTTGSAFNPNTSLLVPENQISGLYQFQYIVSALAPCPNDTTVVELLIEPSPVADAGEDMTLDCIMNELSIGGASSEGTEFSYTWTTQNGSTLEQDDEAIIEINAADTYTLTVVNEQNGCITTDEVSINSDVSILNPNVSIRPITCFQANDGLITIDNIEGGVGPYSYALNNGNFDSQSYFPNLSPGVYVLTIRDSKGCETQLEFDFAQPEQLEVRLITNLEGEDEPLSIGDSLVLTALINIPEETVDSVIWYPDSLNCPNCLNQTLAPQQSSAYSVTVIDENGCSDSDNTTVLVEKIRNIYIPNAFSPNNDGINDVMMIFSGTDVVEVKSFYIFNRWGEVVYEGFNFQPNDPSYGWYGIFRGQLMNPAVFVYQAEIEMIDGEVILLKGDVHLVK